MKITIRHAQSSIDPSGTIPDNRFPGVLAALESAYEDAILREYPGAEIEFEESSDTNEIVLRGIDDGKEYESILNSLNIIVGTVYETGNFWE